MTDDVNSSEQRATAPDEPIKKSEDTNLRNAWMTFVAGLFALIGLGFGLLAILFDAVDEDLLELDEEGLQGFEAAVEAAFSFPITGTPYLAIVLSVGVGAALGGVVNRPDAVVYRIAAASAAAGTAALWVLAALFASVPLEASLDIGGLLINVIIAAVVASLVAVGAVWLVRTRVPAPFRPARPPEREP